MDLVFATNNLNKLSEIKSLVSSDINILSLSDINCQDDLSETGFTIKDNALQKANYIFDHYGVNCFSDDTGLEIDVLGGAPGVYSARYAGANCDSEKNIKKVLQKLKNEENRYAKFRTIIALIINGQEYFFEGECIGDITTIKRGFKGFGYDPIFKPLGYNKTFAQMDQHEKGNISHRGKAVTKLINFLNRLEKNEESGCNR